jgi:hypothetical protein
MVDEAISIIFLLVVGGLSGFAGYLGRRAQKVEDRKDVTYLEKLPTIYSNLIALDDAIDHFKSGEGISAFVTYLSSIKTKLSEAIFSANILVFEKTFHEKTYSLFKKVLVLEAITKQTQEKGNENEFRTFAKNELTYKSPSGDLEIDLKGLIAENKSLILDIKNELNRYSSISSRFILIVILIGIMLAGIEILTTVFEISNGT